MEDISNFKESINIYHSHCNCMISKYSNCKHKKCLQIRDNIRLWKDQDFNLSNWNFELKGSLSNFIKNKNDKRLVDMYLIMRKHKDMCNNDNCEYIDCKNFKLYYEIFEGLPIQLNKINPLFDSEGSNPRKKLN